MASAQVQQSDQLYSEGKFQENHDLLKKAYADHPDDAEIGWRFCRSYFDLADTKPNDKTFKQKQYEEGLAVSQTLITKFPDHWAAHKWYAVMLSSVGEFQALKDKISNAFKVKEHAIRATELKPDDATTFHLLGRWCYSVSNVGWMERKVAGALFATPPSSTYEEALTYFLKSADIQCSIRNAVFVGDTYIALIQKDKAREWYSKAVSMPPVAEVDKVVIDEANTKLKKL